MNQFCQACGKAYDTKELPERCSCGHKMLERTIKEGQLAEAFLQFDARHLCLIDRRDLWHLVENAYRNTAISGSKACELIGVPIGHARHILEEWEKKR